MSRSKQNSKVPWAEYNGKRPFTRVKPCAQNKKITHKMERAQAEARKHMELSKILDEDGDR